jgi:hypothetical protein
LYGAFAVAGAGIELVEGTVVTSPRVGCMEWVAISVFDCCGAISIPRIEEKPGCLKPRSKPPEPEKRLTIWRDFLMAYHPFSFQISLTKS